MHQHFGKRLVDTSGKPYTDDTLNRVYEQLFCDDIEAFRNANTEQAPVWSELLDKNTQETRCKEIAEDDSLESRLRLCAYRKTATLQKHLFGAVVEIFRDKNLNVVAAYRDGSARAINDGRIIDWEDLEDAEIREAIVTLLSASAFAMGNLDPWNKPRLPFPNRGLCRFTVLSSDSPYFGQGAMDKLMKDPVGKPVMEAALDLLVKLSMKAK